MVDVVKNELSDIPDHIHLILPEEKINTYDILDIADLGLVYTTTVGLEMAMRGIPVVVAGETHYRDRGFTCDPNSWIEYVEILNTLLGDLEHARLSQDQIELAWRYAYLFFFEFPKPFPWHLLDFKKDIISRPLEFVLGEEGQKRYNQTFEYLTGTPLEW
jgi:capsule polysaccharide export protein KpsC/LpsZ